MNDKPPPTHTRGVVGNYDAAAEERQARITRLNGYERWYVRRYRPCPYRVDPRPPAHVTIEYQQGKGYLKISEWLPVSTAPMIEGLPATRAGLAELERIQNQRSSS